MATSREVTASLLRWITNELSPVEILEIIDAKALNEVLYRHAMEKQPE